MPSLKDVAKESGVSATTVSAVVNGANWVPDATKQKVQTVIDTLGYRPNMLARSLKRQETDTIGVIVTNLASMYQTEIVRQLSHALLEYDRNLFLCDSDYDYKKGDKSLQMLLEKQVAGVIILGDAVSKSAIEQLLNSAGKIPVVAIERDFGIDHVHTIVVNSEQAAFNATKHLIEKKRKRIAIIAGPSEGAGSNTYGRIPRFEGYKRALKEHGLAFDPDLVVEGNFRIESGQIAMGKLLALPTPPDAVFAINDMMAIGALRTMRQAAIRVPDDIALIGYDDNPLAPLVFPTLSTMGIPQKEIAQTASDILQKALRQKESFPTQKYNFSAHLVVRESS